MNRTHKYKTHLKTLALLLLSSAVCYVLLGYVLSWQLEVRIAMRTMTHSHYSLSYSEPNQLLPQETRLQTLIASQFFTQHILHFDKVTPDKVLKLYLDDTTQFYFIKNIHVEAKAGFFKQVIGDWNGKDIFKLLKDQSLIEHATDEFILLNNQQGNGFVLLDGPINPSIRKALTDSSWVVFWRIVAAIVCGIFISFFMTGNLMRNSEIGASSQKQGQLTLSAICFFGIILLVMLNSIYSFIPDKKSHENRAMAALEPLNTQNVFRYPDILTNYTNDHFAFRNLLFTMHSFLRGKLFRSSTLPERVFFGKKGWLFEADSFAMNDFRRLNRFSDTELKGMLNNLQERIHWLKARGIKYYIMVPPNRNRIYNEYFPKRFSVVPNYGHDRLDYYKQFLAKSGIELIDPSGQLQQYKQIRDVYYSTDTHWNIFGAWVGYQDLLNHIRRDFPCLHPIEYNDLRITDSFNKHGDLSGMLGLENVYKRKEMILSLKDTNHTLEFPPQADIIMSFKPTKRIDTCGLKMMMFRDSYANYLIPFLNLHFKETTYVWSYDFLSALIEEKKPDIVILEVQQRAMLFGLHNPNLLHQP